MAKRLLIIIGALLVVILGFFLLLRKPAVAPTVGNATNTASSDEVQRLAKAAVQWDQYRLDPTVELGTGDCGDQTWTAAIDELNSDQRKSYKLNGVLTLVTTPNAKQWTNDQFQAYAQSDQAICGEAGIYPLHAYKDKLLWVSSCDMPTFVNANSEIQSIERCDIARAAAEALR